MRPHVVVCENCLEPEHPALVRLADDGYDVFHCNDGEQLLEEVVQHRPVAVIYQVRPDSLQDLGVLKLLRRVAPRVPLVLLASEGSLDTQRLFLSLRPIYYAVLPVEPTELTDAIRSSVLKTGNSTV